MQSRTLFVTLFILMCLMFAVFATEDGIQNEDMLSIKFNATDEQIAQWKQYLSSISPSDRTTLLSKLKAFYANLPDDVQDRIAQVAADYIEKHNVQLNDDENDLLAIQEDPTEEFICGGLCIAAGVAVVGGLGFGGYKLGSKQGKKAPPVIHKHYHDDDMDEIPWKKFLDVFKFTRDATKGVLTNPNPGVHTHHYHYDDDEATPQINVDALKEWAAKWRSMTPEEKQRQKEIFAVMWNNMSKQMHTYYKGIMRAALQAQGADPEDDGFVCGGICIGLFAAGAIGVFTGARHAGRDNNQRHQHHHYKKK